VATTTVCDDGCGLESREVTYVYQVHLTQVGVTTFRDNVAYPVITLQASGGLLVVAVRRGIRSRPSLDTVVQRGHVEHDKLYDHVIDSVEALNVAFGRSPELDSLYQIRKEQFKTRLGNCSGNQYLFTDWVLDAKVSYHTKYDMSLS
jgi:hypothetical protein